MSGEKALREYERDTKALELLPQELLHAASELTILAYATLRSPTRTAWIAAYLALRESGVSRNEINDFMERRQQELAGGRAEPVADLVASARALLQDTTRQDSPERIMAICTERYAAGLPEAIQTVICPVHGHAHTYETRRKGDS
jgi:hypothetical protein